MGLTTVASPKSLLALDTEVAAGWWWYDGKTTHRVMMWVGQWVGKGHPFGWIRLPQIILDSDALPKYTGLPVVDKETFLLNVRDAMAAADVLVGHNLTGFDIGGLNGELKLAGLPLLETRPVIDTLKSAAPTMGQAMSLANRLDRLEGVGQKPRVAPAVWEAAFNEYEPDALFEVWERATADVQGHIDLFINDLEKGYV